MAFSPSDFIEALISGFLLKQKEMHFLTNVRTEEWAVRL